MSGKSAEPTGLGLLFDKHAQRGQPTVFRFSRPLDMAPEAGTELGVPALSDLVSTASGWLYAAGARPGDRVAICKANHWDYLLLACAAARLGAIPALVSDLLPMDAVQTLLKRLDPAVLVTGTALLSAGDRAGADLTGLARRTLSLDGTARNAITRDDVRGTPVPAPRPRSADQPMIATHTSGTTGISKLVVHSANTLMGHLGRTESLRWPVVGMKRRDTVATSIAFCHVRAVSWSTGTLALAPREALLIPESDPAVAERVFRAHPPTYLEALPATYSGWEPLTEPPSTVFDRVRLYVSTFDAMHPPTIRRFLRASKRPFPTWLQGWGQSETGPMTFRLLTRRSVAAAGDRHPTTRGVGRPIPGFTALRVVDPATMRPVRNGRPGVVLTKTNGRCLDYVGESDRWQLKAMGPWWNTGDYGLKSRTGAMTLLDREVDVIPGLSCIELEDVLADRLPNLVEAVIIGVPGQLPLPVLCTRDGALDEAAWRHACRDLPELASPVLLSYEDIPRTGTGKVRRTALRDRLLGGEAQTYGQGRWT